jgi:predicted ATPase
MLEQAVALYDPARHGLHAYTYGQDPAVLCLIHAGLALWFLGYPDQALKKNQEGLALARRFSHQGTIATASAFAAQLEQLCRNPQVVAKLAGVAVDLSTQNELAFIKAMGIVFQGWALTQSEQKEAGLKRMSSGLEVLRATDAVTTVGYFSSLLAEVYAEAGQVEEGLKVLAGVDSTRERFWQAELHRLGGELLLQWRDPHSLQESAEAKAEKCFHQALTIAREQKAKSLELRAVMSQCRLWLRQGKRSEARLALEEIFRWFTEGLNTPDLREAKMLLRQLGRQ